MVIDQLASATLLNGSNWVNYLLDENKIVDCCRRVELDSLMKHLQVMKDGLMSRDDIFIHIINCPYTVLTVCMKSFGRALHLYGLISCMLAVHCSKNHHRA